MEMAREFNARIHALQREISVLDEQTRVSRMDCH
jgi:hypothetical protein